MKKILLLLTSLVLLTGCINVSIHGAKEDEKTSQTETKEASLTFVRAERYKNQPNEILDLAERYVKEEPNLGVPGRLVVFFPGYTFGDEEQRYALLLIVNQTRTNIDRDGNFDLNLEYDGEPILENITVNYRVEESGVLNRNTVAAIPLKITREQEEKMRSMEESSKFKMTMTDFTFKK